jgi:hypothetical protein
MRELEQRSFLPLRLHHCGRVQLGVNGLARQNLKVVWVIVAFVLVLVVDDFTGQQGAAKLCLRNDAVEVTTADSLVAFPVVAIGEVAVTGAKLMHPVTNVLLPETPVESLTAMMAIQFRSVALCRSDASLRAKNRFGFLKLAVVTKDRNAADRAGMFFFHAGQR